MSIFILNICNFLIIFLINGITKFGNWNQAQGLNVRINKCIHNQMNLRLTVTVVLAFQSNILCWLNKNKSKRFLQISVDFAETTVFSKVYQLTCACLSMQWKVGLWSEADGMDRAEWAGQQSGTYYTYCL